MSEINTEIVGKVIQGYKILKPLGQGKFSTVYQAQRLTDQKLVALKIIKVVTYNLDF
jgi:serine/threonine protein kinase